MELGRLVLSSAADGSAAQQAELATLGAERARVLADEERLRGEVVKLRSHPLMMEPLTALREGAEPAMDEFVTAALELHTTKQQERQPSHHHQHQP